MQIIGLTRAAVIVPVVTFLRQVGAPVGRLLASAGVPAWARTDPEMLIPARSIGRLLAEAARSHGMENLGVLAGEHARIEDLGVFGTLIRRSPTVADALRTLLSEYPRFSSNGQIWLEECGEEVEIRHAFGSKIDRSDRGWQQTDHYMLMLMLVIVRLGGRRTWRPAEVRLQTGESGVLRDAESLAATRVAFAQPSTSVLLPRVVLDDPLPKPAAESWVSLENLETWRQSAPARDFVASIAQAVEMLSWEGYPDVHHTAEFLGVSVRTLQRHLAEAGITHESLVGRARFTTAAVVLEETDTKILEIALDLGYSDHAHFTRAFGRWAGCSPQEYRRRLRQQKARSSNAASA